MISTIDNCTNQSRNEKCDLRYFIRLIIHLVFKFNTFKSFSKIYQYVYSCKFNKSNFMELLINTIIGVINFFLYRKVVLCCLFNWLRASQCKLANLYIFHTFRFPKCLTKGVRLNLRECQNIVSLSNSAVFRK